MAWHCPVALDTLVKFAGARTTPPDTMGQKCADVSSTRYWDYVSVELRRPQQIVTANGLLIGCAATLSPCHIHNAPRLMTTTSEQRNSDSSVLRRMDQEILVRRYCRLRERTKTRKMRWWFCFRKDHIMYH